MKRTSLVIATVLTILLATSIAHSQETFVKGSPTVQAESVVKGIANGKSSFRLDMYRTMCNCGYIIEKEGQSFRLKRVSLRPMPNWVKNDKEINIVLTVIHDGNTIEGYRGGSADTPSQAMSDEDAAEFITTQAKQVTAHRIKANSQ